MNSKAHILIVEDKALIYKRLKMVLNDQHYIVSDYTPSVEEAIARINCSKPDLVLLDINLQSEYNGIYLGQLLKNDYHIPFIYVTEIDDDQTFYKALDTGHEDFVSKHDLKINPVEKELLIQTKPHLDERKLLRAIQNVLKRAEAKKEPLIKDGIMGMLSYLDSIKNMNHSQITKVPVRYNDIVFFTVKPFINEDEKEEVLKPNYVWFQTNQNSNYYFLKTSLKELQKTLPYYFVRINESYIVNISSVYLKGRINGSKMVIWNKEFVVKKTYKNEVEKRLNHFYQ